MKFIKKWPKFPKQTFCFEINILQENEVRLLVSLDTKSHQTQPKSLFTVTLELKVHSNFKTQLKIPDKFGSSSE